MTIEKETKKGKLRVAVSAMLILALLASVCQNVYYYFWGGSTSYMQRPEQVYLLTIDGLDGIYLQRKERGS